MPGGRPAEGKQHTHPEFTELAAWFRQALADAGHPSVNAFVQRHPFDKNRIYGLVNGFRFLPLDSVRAIAVALGHKAEDVEPIWWRAKAAIDRAAAERYAERTSVADWTDLPWPHPALQDILEAQCHAVDVLPYHLLDIEPPPLSTVYVRQQAKPRPAGRKQDRQDPRHDLTDESRGVDDTAVSIDAALDRHEHLIITGEPGAGKSTLAQYLALVLSRLWLRTATGDSAPLREPVVPLRVPARGLIDPPTWSAALSRATQQALGPRLVAEPATTLFEKRVQGVRWLVLVDGLDEIVNAESRTSVIQALAARCRPRGDYRIIIMTRQLTQSELAPLRAQGLAMYSLEPFSRTELATFAESWFTVQRKVDPVTDATTFLRQIDDGELRELARNPLLATLAAIAYTLEPGRPLPAGRLGLYERFFEHLVVQDASGRRTMSELRRLYAGQAARIGNLEWLHQHRVGLLRHLALIRLDSERPLLDAAGDWVSQHATNLPPEWKGDVETILRDTGLLVFDGNGLRFLHHSFAEFLAAQEHASRAGPEFSDVEAWIDRALRPAEREYAMFMFAMWGQGTGHNLGLVFDALLRGHPDRLMLAGRLLARATTATEADNRRVVDRLIDLAIGCAVIADRGGHQDASSSTSVSVTSPSSVTEILGQLSKNAYAGQRLLDVAAGHGTPMWLRIAAAEALGRVDDRDDALIRLRRLAESSEGMDRVTAARSILSLAPDDNESTSRLIQIATDQRQNPGVRAEAASELSTLGNAEQAAECSSMIIALRPIDADVMATALTTWLACTADTTARSAMMESLAGEQLLPSVCVKIASALSIADLRVDAAVFAARALADPFTAAWQLQSAAKLYAEGTTISADGLWATLPAAVNADAIANIAKGLAEAGNTDLAVTFARAALSHPGADGHDMGTAAVAWLAAAGESAMPAVRESIDQAMAVRHVVIGSILASRLAEAGHRQLAIEHARKRLLSADRQDWELSTAIEAWLQAAGTSASAEISDVIRSLRPLNPTLLAIAAEGAALGGSMVLAEELATEALAAGAATTYRLGSVARALSYALGPLAGAQLHDVLTAQPFSGIEWIGVTDHLCASGAVEAAQRIWSEILTHPRASLENVAIAAARLTLTGAAAAVVEAVRLAPPERVTALATLATAISTQS